MNVSVAWIVAAACAAASITLVATAKAPGAQCGEGFFAVGHRCCPAVSGDGEVCGATRSCPPPLVEEGAACIAPDVRVAIPETHVMVGPSDWEADGLVHPHEVDVKAFAIDAFEITEQDIHGATRLEDAARAAGSLTRAPRSRRSADSAVGGCRRRTNGSPQPRRRKRRATRGVTPASSVAAAAWGLTNGPCAHGALGPDTVGAHASGDGPLGIHDLAGNVAEWVSGDRGDRGLVVGGSYADQLASDLLRRLVAGRSSTTLAERSPRRSAVAALMT